MTAAVDTGPRHQSRKRGVAVWLVLVLAGVLLLVSSFAIWVNRVALNTSVFADTTGSLLENDEIRSAVSARVAEELFANVDVQAELEANLPPRAQPLSVPLAGALEQAAYQAVNRALERPVFQELFRVALAESHGTVVVVLEGGGDRVSTEGGVVTLDLRPILIETADRVGLGDRVADRIPEDAGQVVVLQVDELDTAQNVFQLLKTLAWVLPILTLLVFGLAVWLSGDRRRAARNVGAVIAAVGLVGLVAARLGGNYLVDALTSEPEGDAAGNAAWDILTDLLRHSFRTMVIVGILFMVAAWLAGPRSSASGARRALAPALRNRIWPYLALAVAGLALLYSSEVLDASRLIVVAVLVTLGAVWIEVLRKQSLDEAPNG